MLVVRTFLLLALSLHISGEQQFVVRSGDTVTLPCGNVTHTNCTWTREFQVRLTARKRISKNVLRFKRRNLTENCELQIHDVKPKDDGVYVCHPLGQSQNSSEAARGQRSENILTVITISNQTVGYYRTWVCSVMYKNDITCGYMVKWLVQDSEQSRFQFWAMECSARVTYTEGTSPRLSCEVTDLNRNQVFVLDAAGRQLAESGQEEAHDFVALVTLLMLVLRSVMVCVVMVILIRETRGQWRMSE